MLCGSRTQTRRDELHSPLRLRLLHLEQLRHSCVLRFVVLLDFARLISCDACLVLLATGRGANRSTHALIIMAMPASYQFLERHVYIRDGLPTAVTSMPAFVPMLLGRYLKG